MVFILREDCLEAIEMDIIVQIATIGISAILCLFGVKLMRIGNALAGIILGAGIGYFGSGLFAVNIQRQILAAIVGAALFAIFAAFFKKIGTFLFCMVGVTGMLVIVTRPTVWIFYAIYGGIGMLFAIAAMNWLDAIYIFATSFVGGIGVGTVLMTFLGKQSIVVCLAVYIVPIVLGCCVQFILKSREIGRKEVLHAEEVKKELSVGEEVESLRNEL